MATSLALLALLLLTSAPDFLAWFCHPPPSPGGHSESNVSGPNKPDTEQAKIDAHLEQQHRKAETSPSGVAATVPPSCSIFNQGLQSWWFICS
jgi:hypothetical protein